jgi:hypothetical protein
MCSLTLTFPALTTRSTCLLPEFGQSPPALSDYPAGCARLSASLVRPSVLSWLSQTLKRRLLSRFLAVIWHENGIFACCTVQCGVLQNRLECAG